MRCAYCGHEDEGNFCSYCGKPLVKTSTPELTGIKAQPANYPNWTTNCPVCRAGALRFAIAKGLFGPGKVTTDYYCDHCQAYFGHKNGKYALLNTTQKNSPIWVKYHNRQLNPEEWARIANGGQTNEEILNDKLFDILAEVQNGEYNIQIIGAKSPVILKKDEEIKIVIPGIALMEPRSVRTSSGSYAGPSFRIAKGVTWRMGSFGSTSESHEEIKTLDTGILTVTNQRIVFIGSTRNSEIPVSKIVSLKPYTDGVMVQINNRARPQYFAGIKPDMALVKLNINNVNVSTPFDGRWLTCIIEGAIKKSIQK